MPQSKLRSNCHNNEQIIVSLFTVDEKGNRVYTKNNSFDTQKRRLFNLTNRSKNLINWIGYEFLPTGTKISVKKIKHD